MPELSAREIVGVQPMHDPKDILRREVETIEKEREEKSLKKLTGNGTIQ